MSIRLSNSDIDNVNVLFSDLLNSIYLTDQGSSLSDFCTIGDNRSGRAGKQRQKGPSLSERGLK